MEKLEFEKFWNYNNDDVTDEYLQNAWNQTLHGVLNEIKGSSLNSGDTIYVSYVLKDLIDSLMWLDKPSIIYRYDNQHSIFFKNGRINIENYIFNHQKDEEWIESQKNVFLNLNNKPINGIYPDIMSSKEKYIKYLNSVFSSGRIIEKNDIVYSGILFNFIKNENNLIHFHIDELKDLNTNLYEYCFNENNEGLIPHLTLKTAWKIKNVKIEDIYSSLSKIGYRIKNNLTEIDNEIKYTIILPENINLNIKILKKHFSESSLLNVIYDKCNPKSNKIFIFYDGLDSNLDNFNYRLCGSITLSNKCMMDLDYEKNISYEDKVKIFEDNVSFMLKNSTFIGQITKQNLNDVYELLKNKNVLVPNLPIFRYNNKVMSMGKGEINDDFEHGKYAILTAKEITQFLQKNYTVFLYNVFDNKYNDSEDLKYQCVILEENVD